MTEPRVLLLVIALLLIGIAGGIAWRQRRAATCTRHSRRVGIAAWALAACCLLAASVLIVLAARG